MKTIIKSFYYNKTIRKYALCLIVMLAFIIFLLNFKVSLEQKVTTLKNKILIIEVDSNKIIDKLKEEKNIEKIEKLEYSYKITFKNYNDISSFRKKYSKELKNITSIYGNESKDTTIIENVILFVNIIIYIVELLMFIALLLNINQIISETKYDISLYKLVGYKNVDILKRYIIIFIVFIILFYFVSFIFNFILIILLNLLFKLINLDFIIGFSNKNIVLLIVSVVLSLCLTFLNFKKISNISPMDLVK